MSKRIGRDATGYEWGLLTPEKPGTRAKLKTKRTWGRKHRLRVVGGLHKYWAKQRTDLIRG